MSIIFFDTRMILDRIKQFIDSKGIAVSAFERSVGMSNASFGKSLRNGGAIGTDKLENILSVYPELSPLWLITGEGSMLRHKDEAPPQNEQSIIVSQLLNTIKEQAEEIGHLKAHIEELERRRGDNAGDAQNSIIANAG